MGADAVEQLRDVATRGVTVGQGTDSRGTAEQLVERQPGDLGLDVPERHVDRGDRRHRDRAASPVGAAVEVLPGVLDRVRVPADEQRRDVVPEVGRDGELPPVERGVTQAGDAVGGDDAQRDEIAARRGDDDVGGGDRGHAALLGRRAPPNARTDRRRTPAAAASGPFREALSPPARPEARS